MLITLARNVLLGQFLCPSPSLGNVLTIEKELRSFGPLGSKLWLLKEGNRQICLKIEAFLTLIVNPISNT